MPQVDPVLYSMAEELVEPGSIVWDVGANAGYSVSALLPSPVDPVPYCPLNRTPGWRT